MKVTILGCGSSSGTPAIGMGWGNCDSANSRNRRMRPSILVQDQDTNLLVDTSPDFREQILRAGINRLDGICYTHHHADHLHGIDDLRPINRAMGAAIDIFGDRETLSDVRERFGYVLEPLADGIEIFYKPTLTPHEIVDGDEFSVGSIPVRCFEQDHGTTKTMGYRFGNIAYSTDLVEIPEKSLQALEGVRVWIVGTLTNVPHPTHAHVDKALEWISRIKPERAYLTHMSGLLDYDTLASSLPDGIEPAYDGLEIVI